MIASLALETVPPVLDGDIPGGGPGNDQLEGTATADRIVGLAGSDILYGRAGNDVLVGGFNDGNFTGQPDGDDQLYGGDDNDLLIGGVGNDKLYGEGGDDVILTGEGYGLPDLTSSFPPGSPGFDTVDGGAGYDYLILQLAGRTERITFNASSVDTVHQILLNGNILGGSFTGIEHIRALLGSGNDLITGTTGNDELDGGVGDDIVNGGEGDDYLMGSPGNDTLNGNTGDDTVDYSTAPSRVYVTLATTSSQGTEGSGSDTLLNIDNLIGSNFNDLLFGNDERNVLRDFGGATDLMDGAGGNDVLLVARYTTADSSVTLRGGTGNDYISFSGPAGYHIGAPTLEGGDDDDTIVLASFDHAILSGGAGFDTLDVDFTNNPYSFTLDTSNPDVETNILRNGGMGGGRVSGFERVIVHGWTGNDILTAGANSDVLYGGAGFDVLNGGGGSDLLYGDDGADTLSGGAGNDLLNGGTGVDILYGNQDNDILYGNQDNDILYGGQGNDAAYGGQGNDSLFGNLGDDQLFGNLGDDVLNGGVGANTLDGGDGIDTVSYVESTAGVTVSLAMAGAPQPTGLSTDILVSIENLAGTAYADTLTGDGLANVVSGNGGADTLSGGFGADILYGNQDNDILYGNQDNDVLYGGQGDDVIYGGQGDDVIVGGVGFDKMQGNLGADVFLFLTLDDSRFVSDEISDFVTGVDKIDLRAIKAAFPSAGLIIENYAGSTYVSVDINLDDSFDFSIKLAGLNAAKYSDVLWVAG